MAINAVSYSNNYACSGASLISEETRRKLLALGIDPSMATSESQAKTLIEKAQKTTQTNQSQTGQTVQTSEAQSTGEESSERELISKAKSLGSKMGLSFSDNATLDEMLSEISSKISEVLNSNGNESEKSQYMQYNTELGMIKEGYSVVKQNENNVLMSMNYSADINKVLLGLQ